MADQRLLERIKFLGTQETIPAFSRDREIASILAHMHNLICTRKGTVPIDDNYGMPDVFFSHGVNFKESSRRMLEAISNQIRKYEPRIFNVTIDLLSKKDELLQQRFGLKGYLTRDNNVIIECMITVSSEAKIKITLKDERE